MLADLLNDILTIHPLREELHELPLGVVKVQDNGVVHEILLLAVQIRIRDLAEVHAVGFSDLLHLLGRAGEVGDAGVEVLAVMP